METWLKILFCGWSATIAMTAFLLIVDKLQWANANMVNAIGSLVTRGERGAFPVGLAVHFTVGTVIAAGSIAVWSLFDMASVPETLALGTVVGTGLGLVVSIMLVVLVAEHHPLELYREAGLRVAVAHLAAHVVYGVILGLTVGLSGTKIESVQRYAKASSYTKFTELSSPQ